MNVWDSQNRLFARVFGGHTSSFTYGPDGLRRQSVVDTTATTYVLDGQNVVQGYSGGSLVGSYLYGPRGPECKMDSSGNTLFWFLYDGHGNAIAEVLPDGSIRRAGANEILLKYDVWGGIRNTQELPAPWSPLLYCGSLGHPSENATGLLVTPLTFR